MVEDSKVGPKSEPITPPYSSQAPKDEKDFIIETPNVPNNNKKGFGVGKI